MGRRSNKKYKNPTPIVTEKQISKNLPLQKRQEVNDIVKKLLNITSQIGSDGKVEWEAHLEIDNLLKRVQEIEPEFKVTRNREDHFSNLMAWIRENGGVTDSIRISKYEDMGHGLEAVKDFQEGDLICAVPRKVMMTLDNVRESPLKYLYENNPILKNMGNVALALFLILEYLKDKNSFWYSYISSLPNKYNTVLYFAVDDFLEMKCSPTFEPSVKHCRNIARQYAYFKNVFQTSNDEASLILKNNFTYQLYRWAVSTVMTRQNFVPSREGETGINGLIPLWDMCNHTNGYLSTQYKVDRSECLACKSFKKGDQVLIFYGQRSNQDFFVHNGFVYEGNDHDSYRIRLGISKADKLHDLRCDLLKALGIPESGDFYLHSGPEPVREQLLAFLRIFNMDEDHLNHWKSSNRLSDLMWKDCALDTRIESKVWNFLYNRINLLLRGYSQHFQGDESDVPESRRLVRTQMCLEKKFLESTLEYVQQRIKI